MASQERVAHLDLNREVMASQARADQAAAGKAAARVERVDLVQVHPDIGLLHPVASQERVAPLDLVVTGLVRLHGMAGLG